MTPPPTYHPKKKLHSDFILRLLNKSWKEKVILVNFIKPKKIWNIFLAQNRNTCIYRHTPWTLRRDHMRSLHKQQEKKQTGMKATESGQGNKWEKASTLCYLPKSRLSFRPTVFQPSQAQVPQVCLGIHDTDTSSPMERIILYISQFLDFLPPLWPDH